MFSPSSPETAANLDRGMREDLARSLERLGAMAGAVLPDDVDLAPALVRIRDHRVDPGVFARYYDLVFSLQAGAHAQAGALWREIAALGADQTATRLAPFGADSLGDDAERFGRLFSLAAGGAPMFAPPDAAGWRHFEQRAEAAFELLEQVSPAWSGEVRNLLTRVIGAVPAEGAGLRFAGASCFMAWGAVVINVAQKRERLQVLASLVHEATHQLLFGAAREEPLTTNPPEARYASPLRRDPRPMDGVFHATYVAGRLAHLYARLEAADRLLTREEAGHVRERAERMRRRFGQGDAVIAGEARLTPLGRRLIDEARRHVMAPALEAQASQGLSVTGAEDISASAGRWAVATGAPLPPGGQAPARLIDAIAARLGLWPDGMLWTCDEAGHPSGASYQTLWRRAEAIAAGLAARGIGTGRIVALATRSALDFTPAFWACLKLGCVILPLAGRVGSGTQGRDEPLVQILGAVEDPVLLAENASPAHAVARRLGLTAFGVEDLERLGADASARPAPAAARATESPACLLPTSGSTGQVKLAALSEPTLIRRQFLRRAAAADPDEVRLFLFDLASVTGLNAAFPQAQRTVQLPPSLVAGRPLLAPETLERHRVRRMTLTCSLAGLVAGAMEKAGRAWDLSSLRRVNLGGETVDPHVAARLREALAGCGARDLEIFAGYGATETGSLAAEARVPQAPAPGTAAPPLGLGGPAAGVSLRIADEATGALRREGEVGLIEARAPGLVFCGYWGDEAASAEAFTADGWWRTGDLGALRDGRLSLHGRAKDVIIVRGRKSALADIDAVLQAAMDETGAVEGGARVLACAVRGPADATERLAAVVFASAAPADEGRAALEAALRRAAARTFGLGLQTIAHAPLADLPLGPGGKAMRGDLVRLLPAVASRTVEPAARDASSPRARLEALWREVLERPSPVTPACDFFELGGDSLAFEQLLAGVEAAFGMRIPPDSFVDTPTFGRLLQLVERRGEDEPAEPAASAARWPLPRALHERLLARLQIWPGVRPTADGLVAGLNVSGARPPLFWIFQTATEFGPLAEALGPDQPLYALRSGYQLFSYAEDQVQQVALRYVQDILEICPEGPLFLGANCQGGIIALAVAQHLARRRRAPELLVLLDWAFQLQPYAGKVLFLHGAGSLQGDPRLRHSEPERAWRRLLGECEIREIPGAYGGHFWPGHVEGLAAVIGESLAEARAAPRLAASLTAEDVELALAQPPQRLAPGRSQGLAVQVRNVGRTSWAGAADGDLRVANYWIGPGGAIERWVDARAPLPPLEPGESRTVSLEITAPAYPGEFTLVVDVVEEGGRWLDRGRLRAPWVRLAVEEGGRSPARPGLRALFVSGPPESGASWLQRLLDAHPQVACAGEGHFTEDFSIPLAAVLNRYNGRLKAVAAEVYEGRPYYWPLTQADHDRMVRNFVFERMAARATKPGVLWAGDTTPGYALRLEALARLFPQARFVNIVRDPCEALAQVLADGPRPEDELRTTIERWAQEMNAVRRFAADHPGKLYEVRYEDLLQDLPRAARGLFAFLEVSTADQPVARAARAAGAPVGGRGRKDAGAGAGGLDEALRDQLERTCGELMRLYGYGPRLRG
jgi:HEXXH motif-containing protein